MPTVTGARSSRVVRVTAKRKSAQAKRKENRLVASPPRFAADRQHHRQQRPDPARAVQYHRRLGPAPRAPPASRPAGSVVANGNAQRGVASTSAIGESSTAAGRGRGVEGVGHHHARDHLGDEQREGHQPTAGRPAAGPGRTPPAPRPGSTRTTVPADTPPGSPADDRPGWTARCGSPRRVPCTGIHVGVLLHRSVEGSSEASSIQYSGKSIHGPGSGSPAAVLSTPRGLRVPSKSARPTRSPRSVRRPRSVAVHAPSSAGLPLLAGDPQVDHREDHRDPRSAGCRPPRTASELQLLEGQVVRERGQRLGRARGGPPWVRIMITSKTLTV